ncbi:hypothetical protein BDR04DRAFT_1101456 [Suillus decipiens]|nr:hypothetical protein BDR04DRAFT_1101456 [Suillus decipiens]
MSLHLPTFYQPRSGPVLVNESGVRNIITSPDRLLRISPMSAEGVQMERYDKKKPM